MAVVFKRGFYRINFKNLQVVIRVRGVGLADQVVIFGVPLQCLHGTLEIFLTLATFLT